MTVVQVATAEQGIHETLFYVITTQRQLWHVRAKAPGGVVNIAVVASWRAGMMHPFVTYRAGAYCLRQWRDIGGAQNTCNFLWHGLDPKYFSWTMDTRLTVSGPRDEWLHVCQNGDVGNTADSDRCSSTSIISWA